MLKQREILQVNGISIFAWFISNHLTPHDERANLMSKNAVHTCNGLRRLESQGFNT